MDIPPNQETLGHSLGHLEFLKPHPSCYLRTKEIRDIRSDLQESNLSSEKINHMDPFPLTLSVSHVYP